MKFISQDKEFENILNNYNDSDKLKLKNYVDGFIYQCSVVYTTALVVKGGKFKLDNSNPYISLGSQLISFLPFIQSLRR